MNLCTIFAKLLMLLYFNNAIIKNKFHSQWIKFFSI